MSNNEKLLEMENVSKEQWNFEAEEKGHEIILSLQCDKHGIKYKNHIIAVGKIEGITTAEWVMAVSSLINKIGIEKTILKLNDIKHIQLELWNTKNLLKGLACQQRLPFDLRTLFQ